MPQPAEVEKKGKHPWIVARGFGVLVCLRCGEEYMPATPASVTIVHAIYKAFIQDHRRCKKRS